MFVIKLARVVQVCHEIAIKIINMFVISGGFFLAEFNVGCTQLEYCYYILSIDHIYLNAIS